MLRETTSPVEGFIIDATLCGLFEGIKETESINDHYNYCKFVTLGNFGNRTDLVLNSFAGGRHYLYPFPSLSSHTGISSLHYSKQ